MIELKGIAWDHPRGYKPLIAVSKEYEKHHPYVTIKWDVRSLKEFGDMPVEHLIERYDLITIDHPVVGRVKTTGFPVWFSETPQKIYKPAPLLNGNAKEILKEICRYGDEIIDTFIKEGN